MTIIDFVIIILWLGLCFFTGYQIGKRKGKKDQANIFENCFPAHGEAKKQMDMLGEILKELK